MIRREVCILLAPVYPNQLHAPDRLLKLYSVHSILIRVGMMQGHLGLNEFPDYLVVQ